MLNKAIKERYLQAAKELRRYFNGEEFRASTPDRAFISWYMTARFGKLSNGDLVLCDGQNDGGLDAIVFHENGASVFQMKYETTPRVTSVKRDELAGFEKIAKIFTDKGHSENFEDRLSTVRPNLRNHYRKVFALKNEDLRFIFVTSKVCELTSVTVEIEDIKKILSLWSLYREGFTPPTELIKLNLENTWYAKSNNGFTTYVGLADVQDFLRLMKDDKNERLFAQNVRTDLRSVINVEIKKTYEKNPEEFWLGNNGVYIVCRAVSSSGNRFELTFPSIINGSQTLHSVAASDKRNSCKILVRILEMDVIGNPRLLGEVIRRTNTQNPMKLINLAAHDPAQLNVARYLDRFEIFYERREKEWMNEKKNILPDYAPVNIKELGQWLSLLDPAIGMGRARSRVSELFQENFYHRIFEEFDSQLRSPKYKRLAHSVWAGLLIKNFLRSVPSSKRSLFQIPQLLLIRALIDAIESEKMLRDEALEMLRLHKFGKRRIPTVLARQLKQAVSKFIVLQKRAQMKEVKLDYSNYFKLDKTCEKAYKTAFPPKTIRRIGKTIAGNLSKFD